MNKKILLVFGTLISVFFMVSTATAVQYTNSKTMSTENKKEIKDTKLEDTKRLLDSIETDNTLAKNMIKTLRGIIDYLEHEGGCPLCDLNAGKQSNLIYEDLSIPPIGLCITLLILAGWAFMLGAYLIYDIILVARDSLGCWL